MPRIRRYYPASHMLNRDPEFMQLRRQFADWMGYVWHEMLAWGDHTEGELKGKPDAIAESLSSVSLTNRPSLARKHITNAFQYMQECGWIRIEIDRILILNHAKYHGSREDIKSHEETKKIPPTDRPTEQPTNLESNTYEVLLSSPRQEKLVAPIPAVWPDDGLWLKEFIERQNVAPSKHLLEPGWWKDVATTSGGIDLDFLETEFARMSAWLNENASRAPASRAGWKKFIRHWLERSHEKERKTHNVQLQKPQQYVNGKRW